MARTVFDWMTSLLITQAIMFEFFIGDGVLRAFRGTHISTIHVWIPCANEY